MAELLESLIRDYGYLALLVGTFLEGETILLIAGYAAQRGLLNVELCILSAFIGSMSGDQLAFYVGRFFGSPFLAKRPRLKAKVDKALVLFERHHNIIILSFRFFYGFRNITPFALGTTKVSGLKFLLLNAIGALVWATTFGYSGYFFGKVVEKVLQDIHNAEIVLFALIGLVIVGFWARKRWKNRQENKASETTSATQNSSETKIDS